jgi:predicted regulator of Ras-like GTPase activity (Roadblock/LC7/MglB family)
MTMLRNAQAKCAVLVGQDGQCLAKRGFTKNLDTDALAALVAGSFASTREMAKLVGQPDFSVLFHQGAKDHIHNILVDDETILTVIFDDRTTLGMVRLYSREAAKKLRHILKEAQGGTSDADMEGFDEEAQKRIDDLIE